MDPTKKKKILEAVRRHRMKRKTEGKVDIAGVKDPHPKRPKGKKVSEESKGKKHGTKKMKKPVLVGPAGGHYRVGASGKKEYQTTKEKVSGMYVKKSLETFVKAKDSIANFIKKWKGESNE